MQDRSEAQPQPKTGILLMNLGSPAQPTKGALRTYLKEFLSDRRVIDLPRWKWWPILNFIILNTRPPKSAALYKKIWCPKGAPLIFISKQQANLLQAKLSESGKADIPVLSGMRYGTPSISSALRSLREAGIERIIAIPMYPQYSAASTGSLYDAVFSELKTWRSLPELTIVKDFHADADYITALASSMRQLKRIRSGEIKLVISFHGVPRRYVELGDPYQQQCLKTAELLTTKLKLTPDQYHVAFQSRFGKEPWLTPYTDELLMELPKKGITKVAIMCPGFSADCLETLEEIRALGKEQFMHAGGQEYHYIPALNVRDDLVNVLLGIVERTGGVGFKDCGLL